jgi:hypothetical protein
MLLAFISLFWCAFFVRLMTSLSSGNDWNESYLILDPQSSLLAIYSQEGAPIAQLVIQLESRSKISAGGRQKIEGRRIHLCIIVKCTNGSNSDSETIIYLASSNRDLMLLWMDVLRTARNLKRLPHSLQVPTKLLVGAETTRSSSGRSDTSKKKKRLSTEDVFLTADTEGMKGFLASIGLNLKRTRNGVGKNTLWSVMTEKDMQALTIQRNWRRHKANQIVWGIGGVKHRSDSALHLQRIFRGSKGRSMASGVKVEAAALLFLQEAYASRTLQRFVRYHIARCTVRHKLVTQEASAIKIQSIYNQRRAKKIAQECWEKKNDTKVLVRPQNQCAICVIFSFFS